MVSDEEYIAAAELDDFVNFQIEKGYKDIASMKIEDQITYWELQNNLDMHRKETNYYVFANTLHLIYLMMMKISEKHCE